MLSKGEQFDYLCPECNSPDISQGRMYGSSSGICENPHCRTWWPWHSRIKHPVKDPYPKIKSLYLKRMGVVYRRVVWAIEDYFTWQWRRLSKLHPATQIVLIAMILTTALIIGVFATGKTFGQLCTKEYLKDTPAWHDCVNKKSQGK